MVQTLPDGSTTWSEYAVRTTTGRLVVPYGHTDAERLAAEIGGTVIRRTITHSAWGNA